MADATRKWLGRTDSENSRADEAGGPLGSSVPLQPKGSLLRSLTSSPLIERVKSVGEAVSAITDAAGQFAKALPDQHRSAFLSEATKTIRRQVGPLIDPKQTRSVAVVDDILVVAAICLLMMLMLVLIWLAEIAPSPAVRRKGAEWRAKYEELQEKAQDLLVSEQYTKTKTLAEAMVKEKADAYEQCMELNKFLDENHPCRKALRKVKEALDSLRETLGRRPRRFSTDGFKSDDLVIGITRAIGTLISALADASDKCPNCSFLRL